MITLWTRGGQIGFRFGLFRFRFEFQPVRVGDILYVPDESPMNHLILMIQWIHAYDIHIKFNGTSVDRIICKVILLSFCCRMRIKMVRMDLTSITTWRDTDILLPRRPKNVLSIKFQMHGSGSTKNASAEIHSQHLSQGLLLILQEWSPWRVVMMTTNVR